MSMKNPTRLQVLLPAGEHRSLRSRAKRDGMTVGEWVRQALRRNIQPEPAKSAERKIEAIRRAARHTFPTGDIGRLLEETERGYLADDLR